MKNSLPLPAAAPSFEDRREAYFTFPLIAPAHFLGKKTPISFSVLLRFLFVLTLMGLPFAPSYAQHEGLDWYVNGENHRKQARYDLALSDYDKAVQREPQNPHYLYAKAQCEYQLKRPEAAIQSLQTAVKANATYAPAYGLLGRIYLEKNETENAARLYDIAARYEKDQEKKFFYKTFVINHYIREKKWETAFQKAQEAKVDFGSDPEVRYLEARTANQLKKYEVAREAILAIEGKVATLHQSENAKFYYQLGYAYYHLEDYELASKAWNKANYGNFKTQIEVFSAPYLAKLAESYCLIQDWEKARAFAEKTVRIDAQNATAYMVLAKIAAQNRPISAPLELYEKAARFEKDLKRSALLYEEIANCHLAQENYPAALQAAENGLTFSATHKNLLYLKALSLFHLKRYQEAILAAERVIPYLRDKVEQSQMLFLLGKAYQMMGKDNLARRAYSAVEEEPFKIAASYELRLMNGE
ncbi:tetratricopeptide repeat protein [Hugenholtzia roseola]|uniref:tetratricopeptide repeat protein n=1 Tax=Hugenholtzia roseola TaxID=1002 RepID=UPI000423802A|nr:CDC27 family protein [Hugenholtzia roseola]